MRSLQANQESQNVSYDFLHAFESEDKKRSDVQHCSNNCKQTQITHNGTAFWRVDQLV
jgi:hypothetical protein